MRKPSIFSRDYEMKMRARKKKIILLITILIIASVLIFTKILASELNFDNLKVKVQNWIDSDENEKIISEDENSKEEKESDEKNDEIVSKEPELIKEIKVSETDVLKIRYEKTNGKEIFTEVIENKSNLYTTFNNNKDKILVIDKNQEMKVINIKNEEKIITKEVYVAPNGESFNKDVILDYYDNYIWHGEAKFISDNKIAYISNMPYFGYDLNKYIWTYDITDNNHQLILSSKSKEIKLNEVNGKGLEILLDGNIKYININDQIVN